MMKDLDKHLNDLKFYLLKVYDNECSCNEGELSISVVNEFFNMINKDLAQIKEYWYEND